MISIVIPIYNKEKYILNTIDSVLKQSYRDFELILVDDGSTDGSLACIRSVQDERIRIIAQPNGGVSRARNRGVAEAQSDWIAFLDGDDVWQPDHLQTLMDLKHDFPNCGLYASSYHLQMSSGLRVCPQIGSLPFSSGRGILSNYYLLASGIDFPFNMNSFLVRKADLLGVGGFPEGVWSGEDIITLGRLFARCDFAYTTHPTSVYVLETEGKNERVPHPRNELDRAFDALLQEGRHRVGVRRYVASWYKRRMVGAFLHRKYGLALDSFLRGFRCCPFYRKLYTSLLFSLLVGLTGKSVNELSNKFSKRARV